MPGPSGVSGSSGSNYDNQIDSDQPKPKKQPQVDKHENGQPVKKSDLNGVPPNYIKQQIAEAVANGYSVAQIQLPNGEVVYLQLSQLAYWGYPTPSYSEVMAQGGDVYDPQYAMSGEGEFGGGGPGAYAGGGWGGGPGGGGSTMRMGMGGGPGGGYGPYGPYGGGYGGGGYGSGYGYGNYGGMTQNQFMWDTMIGGQQRDEVYAMRQNMRKAEHQMKVKMRMIMFMLLMGDVVGAVRAMVYESERQNRMFNRLLVGQLNKVREAKSKILLAMGRKHPPTAHDNTNDPAGAARDQNRQAKYTQWVSVTTQLMSEVQNTERQLLDLISEGRRNINELTEAYSGLKEAEARTTRTLIQGFRG